MKTRSVKELYKEGASRVVREAENEPVLISKNGEPAVWMIGAEDMARAAESGGDPDLYRSAIQVLAAKLFDSGVLSMSRAAELAGLALTDFIELCRTLRIPVFRASREGLREEVDAFDEWLKRVRRTPSE